MNRHYKSYFVTLLLTMLCCVQTVFADGTKDMYPEGSSGSRAGILAGTYYRTPGGMPFQNHATMKVYAESGEHILLASSIFKRDNDGSATTRITYKSPDGTITGSFNYENTKVDGNPLQKGYIADRAAELAGPSYGTTKPTNSYTPFELTVPSGQTGVWEIEFEIELNNDRSKNCELTWLDEGNWMFENTVNYFDELGYYQGDNYGPEYYGNNQGGGYLSHCRPATRFPYMMAFDISVAKSDNSALIPGRVFTNSLSVGCAVRGSNWNYYWNAQLYVLTNSGHLYKINTGGINPGTGTLFSNNKGIVSGGKEIDLGLNTIGFCKINGYEVQNRKYTQGGTPLYYSVEFNDGTNIIPTYNPLAPDYVSDNDMDVTHKLFFHIPDTKMPNFATTMYGNYGKNTSVENAWLRPEKNSTAPTLSDFKLKGKENGQLNVISPEGMDIQFEASAPCSYEITLTFPGTGLKEVKLNGFADNGTNSLGWDGKDGNGTLVQTTDVHIEGKVRAGEVHFPWFDLEHNPNNFSITLLGDDWATPLSTKIYWDDSRFSIWTGSDKHLDGAEARDKFYNGEQYNGNNRLLDTWTYVSDNITPSNVYTASRKFIDLEMNSVSGPTTEIEASSEVTFVVCVSNNNTTGNSKYKPVMSGCVANSDADYASISIPGFDITNIQVAAAADPNYCSIASSEDVCKLQGNPDGVSDSKGVKFIKLQNGAQNITLLVKAKLSDYALVNTATHTLPATVYIMRPGDVYELDAQNLAGDGTPLNAKAEYPGVAGTDHNNAKTYNLTLSNSAPVPTADMATVSGGSNGSGNVLANDTDPDGDVLSIQDYTINGTKYTTFGTPVDVFASDGTTKLGTLTMSANGDYTFAAVTVSTDEDVPTIEYTVKDNYSEPKTATSTLDIHIKSRENCPPVITSHIGDLNQYKNQILCSKDRSSNQHEFVPITFYDPDGDPIEITLTGASSSSFIVENGAIYYKGTSTDNNASYTFTVNVSDGNGGEATLNISNAKLFQYRDHSIGSPSSPTLTATNITYGQKLSDVNLSISGVNTSEYPTWYYVVKSGDNIIGYDANLILPVGSYTIIGNANPNRNYGDAEWNRHNLTTTSATFTVSPKEVDIVWSEPFEFNWDGTQKTVPVNVKPSDIVSTTVCGGVVVADAVKVNATGNTGTDANDYTATATGLTNPNYVIKSSATNKTQDWKIVDARPTATANTPSVVYNGADQTPAFEVKVGGTTIDPSKYDITYPTTGTKDVNTYEVTITPKNPTDFKEFKANFGITPKTINVDATVSNKTFDGTTAATITSVVKTDILAADASTVTLTATGVFEDENAADNKDVTVTYTLGGTGASNYQLSAPTSTEKANITPKVVALTWSTPETFEYDGNPHSVTATVSNPVSGYDVTVNGYANSGTDVNTATAVNNYTAIATSLSSTNYQLPSDPNDRQAWSITPKTGTFSIGDVDAVTYDGLSHTPKPAVKVGETTLVEGTDYTITYYDKDDNVVTSPTNAGDYKVVITPTAETPYVFPSNVADRTKTLTINKKELTATATTTDKEYSGNNTAATTVVLNGIVSTDVEKVGVTINTSTFADENVGNGKTVTTTLNALTGSAADNYKLASSTVTSSANITAKEVTLTWLIDGAPDADNAVDYDGNVHTATATVSGAYESVTVSGYNSNTGTAAGNITTTATGLSSSNYNIKSGDETYAWTINAVGGALTIADIAPVTYDGTAHNPKPQVKVGDNVLVENTDFEYVYPTDGTNTNAGTGTVTIKRISTSGYSFADATPKTFTINKAPLTVSTTVADNIYDGDVNVDPSTITASITAGKVSTDVVTLGVTSATFADKNVADNISVNVEYTLTGAAASNYEVVKPTVTGNITPATITVTATVADKDYDGNSNANVTITGISGKILGDDVNVEVTSATFDGKDAQADRPVTANYQITGTAKNNYILGTAPSLEADINAKELTITWPTKTALDYTGSELTFEPTSIEGFVDATDKGNITAVKDGNKGTAIGSYTSKVTELIGTGSGNYTLPSNKQQAWTIAMKSGDVEIILPSESFTYDGTSKEFTGDIIVKVNGVTIPSTAYDVTYENNINANSSTNQPKVVVTSKDPVNYPFAETKKDFNISPKEISISEISVGDKIYDGNVTTSITGATLKSTDIVGSDVVSVVRKSTAAEPKFENANAGTNKPVTGEVVANYELTGAAASNYTLSSTLPTVKGNITPKTLTVTWPSNNTFTFDNVAKSYNATIEGFLEADKANVSIAKSGNTGTLVDNYVSELGAMTGTAASNYQLPSTGLSHDWHITKASGEIIITLPSTTEVYNGEEHQPTPTVTLEGTTLMPGVDYTVSYDNNINAGDEAKVIVTPVSTSPYSFTEKDKDFSIEKAVVTVVEATAATKPYDGTTTANVTVTKTSGIITADKTKVSVNATTANFADKDASATAKAVSVDGYVLSGDADALKNYTLSSSKPAVTGIINQKEVDVTWSGSSVYAYDGEYKTITATVTGQVAGEDVVVATAEQNKEKDVDNYVAKALTLGGADADNYTLKSDAQTFAWKISSSTDIPVISPIANQTYSGEAKEPKPTVKVNGVTLTEGTDYTIEYSNNTNAGTATATIKPLGGYSFEDVDVNFTIDPKVITLTGATPSNKEYDGTKTATVTVDPTTQVTGIETVDAGKLTVTPVNPTFTNASAGNEKEITVDSYTLGGTAAGNYTLTGDPEIKADITAKPLTVTWPAENTFTYDGSVKSYNPIVTGIVDADLTQVLVNKTGNEGSAATNYVSKVTELTGSASSNYSLPTSGLSHPWAINKAGVTPTITLPSTPYTYGGDEKKPNPTVKVGETTLVKDVDYTVEYENNVNAGENTAVVIVKPVPTSPYTFAEEGVKETFSIAKKPITDFTATATDKTFDGTTAASVTVTNPVGVVTGETVTITAQGAEFNNANAAETAKPVTVTKYVLDEASAKNYELTTTKPDVSAKINAKEVEIVWSTPTSFTYNGEEHQITASIDPASIVAGNPVDVLTTVDNKKTNVGNYVAKVTALDNSNYQLPTTGANKAWAISSSTTVPTIAPIAPVTYNSAAQEPALVVKVGENTLVEGTDYEVVYSNNTNAGTATATVTPKGGYSFVPTSATFTIDPKTIEVTDATASNKTYNGTTTAVVTVDPETQVSGIETADAGKLTVTASNANFNNMNAGTDKPVTVEQYVLGGDAVAVGNYVLSTSKPTITADIEKATLSLTPTVTDRVYNGNTSAAVSVNIGNLVVADKPNVTVTPTANFSDKNVGDDKNVTVSYELTGTASGNYKLPYASETTTANITPYEVTLNWSKDEFAYDGTQKTITATVPSAFVGDEIPTVTGYTNNKKTEIGNYTAEATALSDPNYKLPTDATKAWTITTASGTITVEMPTAPLTYNGNEQTPAPVVKFGEIELVPDVDYTVEYENNVNAGTETATATIKPVPGGKFDFTQKEEPFSILPKMITVDEATVSSKVYDGNDNATVTVDPATQVSGIVAKDLANLTVTAKDPKFSDKDAAANKDVTVGGYTIGGTAASNYVVSATTPELKGDITPKEVSLTWSKSIFEYDGTEKTITATVGGALSGETVTVKTYTDNKKTEIGNYTAEATALNDPNYKLPTDATKAWTITTADGTIDVVMPTAPLTYNGEEQKPAPVVTFKGTELVPGVDYIVEYENNVNAGTETATATIKPVTGGKYNFLPEEEPFSILPKTITVDEATVSSKVYDGNDNATVTVDPATQVSGIVAKDLANLTVTAKDPKFSDKDAADDKDVTVGGYTIGGTAAGNYVVSATTPALKADITPKEVSLTWSQSSFQYDGTEKTITATVGGALSGETVTVKTYTDNKKTEIGNYTAEATALSDPNYKLPTDATKAWTITTASGTISVEMPTAPLTYNGNEQTPAPVVKFGEIELVPGVDYIVEYENNVNAGTETATATIKPVTGGKFDFLPKEEPFSILPKTITVDEATVAPKEYNGNDNATVTVDPATQVSGIVAKDLANLTVTANDPKFSDKDAAANKDVTVGGYTIGGTAASNYVVSATTPALKGDITPKEVTLTWSQSSFQYDGTEKTITATVGGALSGETVTVKTYTDNKKTEIGNYTAEATALSDPNYKLPTDATKAWTITTASGTISVEMPTTPLTYNGDEQKPAPVVKFGDIELVPGIDYIVDYKNNVNAGNDVASATIKPVTGGKFKFTPKEEHFSINPKEITITDANVSSKEYDGVDKAVVTVNPATQIEGLLTKDVTTLFVTAKNAKFEDKDAATNKNVTVGEYAISGPAASNYVVSTTTPVLKADITPKEVTLTWSQNSFQYDGTEKTITATVEGALSGETVTVKTYTDNKKTEIGNYTAEATALNDPNYKLPTDATKGWTITTASGTIDVVMPTAPLTYNGEEQTPAPEVKFGDIELTPGVDYIVEYDNNVNAGTGTATIKPVPGGKFDFPAIDKPFTIAPKEITINDATVDPKEYDGNEKATVTVDPATQVSGIVAKDLAELTVTAKDPKFEDKDAAAEKPVNVPEYVIAGPTAGNYVISTTTPALKGEITKAPINVTDAKVASKEYDGNTDATVTDIIFSGVLGTEDVKVEGTGSFEDKNAATGKDVNINYTLAGDDAKNYELVNKTDVKPGDIIKKALDITWSTPDQFIYDEESHSVTPSLIGTIDGDDIVIDEVKENEKTNVGDYKAEVVSLKGNDKQNYSMPEDPTKPWSIAQAVVPASEYTISITAPEEGFTYNGEAKEPKFEVKIGDKVIPETEFEFTYENNVDAGEAKVTISPKTGANYKFEENSAPFTIKKAVISIDATAADKVYDGNNAATVTINNLIGLVAGDDVVATVKDATFNNANAGEDKPVDATFEISGSRASNYELTNEAPALSAEISKKALNLVWSTPSTFNYDGNEHQVTVVDYEGVVAGDEVEVTSYAENTKNNVGNYTAEAEGLSNANYTIGTGATYDWAIVPTGEGITIEILDNDVVYNGEEQTPVIVVRQGDVVIPEGEYDITFENNKNAGEATVTVTDKEGGNYEFPAGKEGFTIKPKALQIVWSDTVYVYDGEQKQVSHALVGVVAGDVVNAIVSGDTATNANKYMAVADSVDNSNYYLAKDSTNWTIKKSKFVLPPMEGIAETERGTNDGHIAGLEEGLMIKKNEGNVEFSPVIDPDMDLEPGDYIIKKEGDDNHFASDMVIITVPEGGLPYIIDSIAVADFGYCPETEDAIRYYATGAEEPAAFRIIYSEEAQAAGFESTDFVEIKESGVLPINIPYCDANNYKAQIQFRSANKVVSKMYDVELPVNLSTRYMVDIFHDVISAVNVEERFVKYQWYHNDEKLEGETKPFYCEWRNLTGSYFMEVETVDNRHLRTCKLYFDAPEEIRLMAYPNPTHDYTTLELTFDNGNEHVLKVVSPTGVEVISSKFTGLKTVINLARLISGTYVVNVDGFDVKVIKY